MVDGYAFTAGQFVSAAGATTPLLPVTLRNSHFLTGAGTSTAAIIGAAAGPDLPHLVEDCYINGGTAWGLVLASGVARNLMIEKTGTENISLPGAYRKFIHNCYFSKGAHQSIALPAAHGDLFQAYSDACNFSFVNCVFYYPGEIAAGATSSLWGDGNYGTQNCVRLADYDRLVQDMFVLSCLGAGANQFSEVWARYAGADVRNVFFVNLRLAPRADYNLIQPGPVNLDFSIRVPVAGASMSNLMFFGVKATDGSAPNGRIGSSTVNIQDGIFNFNKAHLTARSRELLHRLGKANGVEIINWNGDLNPAYNRGTVA